MAGNPDRASGRLRWLHGLPPAALQHAKASTVARFHGQGRPPGQAAEGGEQHERGERERRR
jgi:hypothetical protein